MDISLEIRTDNLNVDVPCAFACACVLVLGHGICIQSTICVLRIFVSVFLFFLERREKMDEYKNTKQKKKEQDALGVRTICMCHIYRTFFECFGENFDFVLNYFVFLEWFQVLSAPYLQSMPAAKVQELEQYSLRNRGLCLVPISCTAGVARSNGADIWAPIKTTSPKFEKAITQFH